MVLVVLARVESDDVNTIGVFGMATPWLSKASAVKKTVSWKNTDAGVLRKRTPFAFEPTPT